MGQKYLGICRRTCRLLITTAACFVIFVNAEKVWATDYYFSNSGNDGNTGMSQDSPWQTVSKMQSAINGLNPGDRILLERGSTWYEVALLITNKNGATNNPIKFEAYGEGKMPVLSGGKLINNFTGSGNIYSTNITSSYPRKAIKVPTGVVINGKWCDIARSEEFFTNGTGSFTQLVDASKSWAANELVGSYVIAQPEQWTWSASPITSNTNNTLTFYKIQNATSNGVPIAYYIANNDSYMSSQGDWTFRNNTLKVFYNSNLNYQKVQFSVSDSIIGGLNSSNIVFKGITFEVANYKHLSFVNGSNITIDNCEFRITAGVAIHFFRTQNMIMVNSYVHHIGAMGVLTEQCSTPIIRNNLFKHISSDNIGLSNYSFRFGAAVSNWAQLSPNAYVEYNYFDSVGLAIQSHTFMSGYTGSYSRNYIQNYGMTIGDCAAIYAASDYDATPKTIKKNIILNAITGGYRYTPYGNFAINPHPVLHPHAIYVDDGGHGYKCDSNSIENTSYALYTNRGHDNSMNYCNIVNANGDNPDRYNAVYLKDQAIGGYSGSADRDEMKYNNIVMDDRTSSSIYMRHTSQYVSGDGTLFYFDHNKIASPFNPSPYVGRYLYNWGASESKYSLSQMQNNTDNVNSNASDAGTVINPQSVMYSDVSGIVTKEDFVKLFTNFSKTNKTFNLGNAVFKDIDGNTVSGAVTVTPFYSKILFYLSGDINTVEEEKYIDQTLIPALSWINDDEVVQNSAPMAQDADFVVEETGTLPTIIGTVVASDPDAGQSLSFSIISGNELDLFTINNTGQLSFKTSNISFAGNPQYIMIVRVSDNGSPNLTSDANVSVELHANGVVENHSPVIAPQSFEADYNMEVPVKLGTIAASDEDSDQHLMYEILAGNDDDLFMLVRETGDLYLANLPSNQIPGSFNFIVKVTDDASESLSAQNTITVNIEASTIVYIDPEKSAELQQDGSYQYPFSSWSQVEWQEGFRYLQKKGTVVNEEKVIVAADHVVVGDYGIGERPVINCSTNEYALKVMEKHDVSIRNLEIRAENAVGCIYFIGAECVENTVENCNMIGADYGLRIIDGTSYRVKYNVFSNKVDGIYSIADFAEIYYNVFKGNHTAVNLSSYSSSAQIYNNVFYDNRQGVSASYAEVALYNNIFYLTLAGDQAINHKLDKLVSNHNVFYPEQSGFIEVEEIRYDNLSDYQRYYGLDMNSFSDDPKFVDVYNDNFSVMPESRVIDAGRIVGLTEDFLGQPVPYGGAPDIGLVELAVPTALQLSQSDGNNELSVYPNPSSGKFNLSFLNTEAGMSAELVINAISGMEVYRELFDMSGVFNSEIDLSQFPQGIYFLSVKAGDRLIAKKLIKQ